MIYICQDAQFSNTKSKEFGYQSYTSFLTGRLDITILDYVTWTGKNGDKSFKELQSILFGHNYSNFEALHLNAKNYWHDIEHEMVYIDSPGFCQKINKVYSGTNQIQTTEKSTLYLVDSYRTVILLSI